ncbi:MAG: type I restriction enzyme HsdR N-terminal domain-containing protein, partial [Thermoplasmata archaeon]
MSTQKEKIIEIISRCQNEEDKVLALDEANTKQTIILPLLQALGWDTTNPSEVRCEQKVGSLAVDYALQYAGTHCILLEVKKPAENLDKHEDQILNYSLDVGVPLAVLTNGIEWRFYLPMKSGVHKKERRFLTFNLFKEDKERVAEELFKFLAKENVISNESQRMAEEELERQQIRKRSEEKLPEAWKELLKEPDPELVKLVSEKVKELFGFV